MKKSAQKFIILFTSCILQCAYCDAQNLVPNPSFEEYDTCPNAYDQIYYASGWDTYLNTSDYYNECSTWFGVPNNVWGYQYASTSNCSAYAGLINFNPFASTGQEFIGRELDTNMIIGQKYFIEMKVSLANLSSCASNNFGVLFSTKPYSFSNPASVINFSHYNYPYIISDTANWIKIFGSFIADSAYKYIIIGNFYDINHTDTIGVKGGIFKSSFAYYYIDDVCVSIDSAYCYNFSHTCVVGESNYKDPDIVIFPNPVNNVLHISVENAEAYNLNIYNAIGGLLLRNGKLKGNIELNISQYSNGIYFLQIIFSDKTINKKIIIER